MPQYRSEVLSAVLTRFPASDPQAARDTGLHVFHAPNSICSQKVRAVLAQLHIPHASHLMNIFAGDTYDPDYVRLRVAGCRAAGLTPADRHLGSTAVASGGCDACVVPTLVDTRTGAVIVDSLRICVALDAGQPGGATLVPKGLATRIAAELAVVDELPNYQHLAVRVIADDAPRNAFSMSKVARCDALLAQHGDDPDLGPAYRAKRAKELMAAESLFDDAAIQIARDAVVTALQGLEDRLAGDGPWVFGDRITMADLFWGAELIRIEDVGQAGLWADGRLPRVAAYADRLGALPALRTAITDFPGARLPRKDP